MGKCLSPGSAVELCYIMCAKTVLATRGVRRIADAQVLTRF